MERAEYSVWSSARAHISAIEDDILSAEGWLQERELNAYREFLKDEGRKIEASIRKATSCPRRQNAQKRNVKKYGRCP